MRGSEEQITPRIFLVKDDKLFVKLLTVRLKQSGYELVGDAPSREEALQQVELLLFLRLNSIQGAAPREKSLDV